MKTSEVGMFVSKARMLMTRFEQMPMPVIAAIDGVALGKIIEGFKGFYDQIW